MLAGAVHEKVTYVVLVFASILVKAVGGSGTVAARIESGELRVLDPTMLIANT